MPTLICCSRVLIRLKPLPCDSDVQRGGGCSFLRSAVAQLVSESAGETEVVLVNDGARIQTLGQIVEWAKQDARVKVEFFPQLWAPDRA